MAFMKVKTVVTSPILPPTSPGAIGDDSGCGSISVVRVLGRSGIDAMRMTCEYSSVEEFNDELTACRSDGRRAFMNSGGRLADIGISLLRLLVRLMGLKRCRMLSSVGIEAARVEVPLVMGVRWTPLTMSGRSSRGASVGDWSCIPPRRLGLDRPSLEIKSLCYDRHKQPVSPKRNSKKHRTSNKSLLSVAESEA